MHTRMNRKSFLRLAVVASLLMVGASLFAQTPSSTSVPPSPSTAPSAEEGKDIGSFHVTQSIEFGGRINQTTGNTSMYDTLVNLQSGPRILDQTLTMQSKTRQDIFDTLTLSSFGWGGDPEQAARLRVSKYSWYTFSGSYQHMQNYWDYDLFANPLNPPTGTPFIPILNSPHAYYDRQNLYNFDVVVLPMHRVSFRVDYNRNRINGPSFSSDHQGTEALLNQNWDDTMNGFRFGADYRVNKKTTLSYTQMLQWYAGGPTYNLSPFNSWNLPTTGNPVSFGLSWFNGGSPCSAPVSNGLANPVCNGYFDYGRFQHVKTFTPTEQLNLRSSSLKWLDFNGQYQYSHASSSTPLYESFSGLITRSSQLGFNTPGSNSSSRWNSSSADVSATVHLNERMRLVEVFRFRNYSVAGTFADMENAYFNAASLGSASLLNPISTFPPTLLFHNSSSPADVTNEVTINQVAQKTYQNDFQLQYDLTRAFGVRAGFLWTNNVIQPGNTFQAALGDIYYPNNPNRGDCVGLPLNADGSCTFADVIAPWGSPTTEINRYAGTIGAWYRAGALHANVDAQIGGADNWLYRIDPTRFFNIRGNASYAPRPWLTVGANFVLQQGKNNASDIQFNQHNYVVMGNATITPNKHWGLDLAYNFDAIQQNMFLCYAGTVNPPDAVTCVGDNSLMQTYGVYQTHTQYGYAAVTLTPIDRLTMRLGYNIVDNQGTTTSLNNLLPLGPLTSTYQTPLATVDVLVHKNVTFKAGWNYYQYNEGSFVGPTASRYFHANNTTLALRYAF